MKLSPLKAVVLALSLPITLATYLRSETGVEYGVGLVAKLALALRMIRNNVRITSGSNFVEHLVMATTILQVPARTEGCLVECGSWKGASAANLSLVAALCDRDLEIFDSFEGLPEPSEEDREHRLTHRGELHTYEGGSWAGSLEEVRDAIERYGAIDRCSFHVGFFDTTLPDFERPCAFVFADADLLDSVKACLEHLWPLLADGGRFYIHEATHMEIAALFFDRSWWAERGCEAPGLIGAGTGLGLIPRPGGFGSPLGYAVKSPETVELRHVPQ